MCINDQLCIEFLMQKVLQKVDEKLTMKYMNTERSFKGGMEREREEKRELVNCKQNR